MKILMMVLFLCGATYAGDAGEYGRSLELRNWLGANNVKIDSLLQVFLDSPDSPPFNDSLGIWKGQGICRYVSDDKRRGYLIEILSKKVVDTEKNGHIATQYFFEVKSTKVFDLTPKK